MAREYLYKALTGTVEQSVIDVNRAKGIVDVLWSRFDNEDADGDIIDFGAYAKTIAEQGPDGANRIKVLWNHMHLIGRPLSLEESKQHNGLVVRQKLTPTTGQFGGYNALMLYMDDVFTEHSVRISSIRRAGEDMPEAKHITEVRLWEGGPQIWGANHLTPTLGAKSDASALALDLLAHQLEKAKAALKTGITDELASDIEEWLSTVSESAKQMRAVLRKNAPIEITADADDFPAPVKHDHPDDAPQDSEEQLMLKILEQL